MESFNSKAAFLSGKLTGIKTLGKELDEIEKPDDIELFLKAFVNAKFSICLENEVVYINDDDDFVSKFDSCLEGHEAVSVYVNDSFSRFYVTTKDFVTYVVRVNKVSSDLIGSFISKDHPVKYTLNSFLFVKWCSSKFIDLRNVYDIPTYIKLLTNEIDPFKSVSDYVREYTDEVLGDDDERNCVIIGNFIFKFGSYLAEFVERFNLSNANKLINENSYFEAVSSCESDLCKVCFSYLDLERQINEVVSDVAKKFEERAYLVSPLGRVAIKYGRKAENVIRELYNDDLQLMILNELYNSNVKVCLISDNLYQVSCKYKNLFDVMKIVVAIMKDIFYTMFETMVEIKIECVVKE